MNPITKWALDREKTLIEHKLLRLRVLTRDIIVLEHQRKTSRIRFYYQLMYNKTKEEFDELSELQPSLETRLQSIREKLQK